MGIEFLYMGFVILILLISHGIVLGIGWKMGIKINRPVEEVMSKPTKNKKAASYHDEVDIFNEATLDFE